MNNNLYNLIYRDQTKPFEALETQMAMSHTHLLKFNTREEYLEWVKDWKAVYNDFKILHRYRKIHGRYLQSYNDQLSRPEDKMSVKCHRLKVSAEQWKPAVDRIMANPESVDRLNRWKKLLLDEKYVSQWYVSTGKFDPNTETYLFAAYLPMVRKASKIKARIQRAQRIAPAVL